MGKRYEGILMCSDFDGTLYWSGSFETGISRENREAIKYFQANGGLFTICTGRFPRNFVGAYGDRENFFDYIVPNTYIIGMNGSCIYDRENDKYLYEHGLDADDLAYAADFFDKNEGMKEFIVYNNEDVHKLKAGEGSAKEFIASINGMIPKIVYVVEKEHSDRLEELIEKECDGKRTVGRSWSVGLELQNIADSKGAAVHRMRELLKDKVNKVVCVGDYENDMSMLIEADIGYAVGNALDRVKKVADRITVGCKENAIAKIIEEL